MSVDVPPPAGERPPTVVVGAVPEPGGDVLVRRERRRNGLPAPVDRTVPLPRRVLGDWRLWMSLATIALFVAAFQVNWLLFVPEHATAGEPSRGSAPP
ncbi:hypothetical protein [Raineyella fluvialis]|uniref:hypothetical protein n=1 Tax=Raineyella fluvialis TaxID=2662261 RepID=UPI00188EC941|nr:hypothetical protein [Raineyella fluvialis]